MRNSGVLFLPRGFSLTVAGGIVQGPAGQSVVTLPPPLYNPFSSRSAAGDRRSEGLFGATVVEPFGGQTRGSDDLWYYGEAEGWSGSGNSDGDGGGGGGGGDSRRHPIVVESGVTMLAGAVNVSVSNNGGEDERWAGVSFICDKPACLPARLLPLLVTNFFYVCCDGNSAVNVSPLYPHGLPY